MTKANLEACHCYQLTSRATFEKMFPGAEVENLPSYPAMPKDIILQVWQYMASPTQAQKPLMFIPESGFQGIGDGESIQAAGRRQLSQKQCNEFLKTSRVVGTTPWNLRGACQYLRDFVEKNADPYNAAWSAPNIRAVLSPQKQPEALPPPPTLTSEDLLFSNRPPAPVRVKATAAKSQAKPRTENNQEVEDHLAAEDFTNEDPPMDVTESPVELPADEPPVPTKRLASKTSIMSGCPSTMRGRNGAPAREVLQIDSPTPKRARVDLKADPVAKAEAKAKAKAGAGKAKAAPKAGPKAGAKREFLGKLPFPPDSQGRLGCSKCKRNTTRGCLECRKRIGLILNEDRSAWVWKP